MFTKFIVLLDGESIIEALKSLPLEDQNDSLIEAVEHAHAVAKSNFCGSVDYEIIKITTENMGSGSVVIPED